MKNRSLSFFEGYSYTIIQGLLGFILIGPAGLVMFAVIGFLFDGYINRKKKEYGKYLASKNKLDSLAKNNKMPITYLSAFIPFIFMQAYSALSDGGAPRSFNINIYEFIHGITNKISEVIPSIDIYSEKITQNMDFNLAIVFNHLVIFNLLICLAILPIIFQYIKQHAYVITNRKKWFVISKNPDIDFILKYTLLLAGLFYVLVEMIKIIFLGGLNDLHFKAGDISAIFNAYSFNLSLMVLLVYILFVDLIVIKSFLEKNKHFNFKHRSMK